ncbi:hypothetical protein FA95DRAFT_1491635 [Auriscalpium vulgare]|uniref:Uncharacterized protein n=1 Tax=Auriscalpium vulgare TaxID=40419 RepID=A0ACB8RV07_9AGAM|nr:hypothetical protein FA95DRAFT_1491635 [Auriscalpium vulgare]
MGLSFDKASIVACAVEGVLYGFSVFMYGVTMWVLFYREQSGRINRPMVVVATLLFIFSTIHVSINFQRLIEGLIHQRDFPEGGPSAWFNDIAEPSFVFKSAVYAMQTLLADGVLIYRCYVVWRSKIILAFQSVLYLGLCVSTVGSLYTVSRVSIKGLGFALGTAAHWVTAYYAITLVTNGLCTLTLAYRIWQMNAPVRKLGRGQSGLSLLPVVIIVLDAGVLYFITLLPMIISFVTDTSTRFIFVDIPPPIISISFYMIILRVAMRRMATSFVQSGAMQQSTSHNNIPLQVHISRLTDMDAPRPESLFNVDAVKQHSGLAV